MEVLIATNAEPSATVKVSMMGKMTIAFFIFKYFVELYDANDNMIFYAG